MDETMNPEAKKLLEELATLKAQAPKSIGGWKSSPKYPEGTPFTSEFFSADECFDLSRIATQKRDLNQPLMMKLNTYLQRSIKLHKEANIASLNKEFGERGWLDGDGILVLEAAIQTRIGNEIGQMLNVDPNTEMSQFTSQFRAFAQTNVGTICLGTFDSIEGARSAWSTHAPGKSVPELMKWVQDRADQWHLGTYIDVTGDVSGDDEMEKVNQYLEGWQSPATEVDVAQQTKEKIWGSNEGL